MSAKRYFIFCLLKDIYVCSKIWSDNCCLMTYLLITQLRKITHVYPCSYLLFSNSHMEATISYIWIFTFKLVYGYQINCWAKNLTSTIFQRISGPVGHCSSMPSSLIHWSQPPWPMDRAVQLSPGRWPMDRPVRQPTGARRAGESLQQSTQNACIDVTINMNVTLTSVHQRHKQRSNIRRDPT